MNLAPKTRFLRLEVKMHQRMWTSIVMRREREMVILRACEIGSNNLFCLLVNFSTYLDFFVDFSIYCRV
jgi:hypothetical protein